MIKHPFEALYNENSKILILGSFPSVKSREQNFFYGHPQNRFWKVISAILNEKLPSTSPANAVWKLGKLTEVWKVSINNYLQDV